MKNNIARSTKNTSNKTARIKLVRRDIKDSVQLSKN